MFKFVSFIVSFILSCALLVLQVRSATRYYLHGSDNHVASLLQIVSHDRAMQSIRFVAQHNNLGTAAILFNNTKFRVDTQEEIIFRLKDATSHLLYEHTYNINQINPSQHYTFGFPSISDSQGKTYIIEIVTPPSVAVSSVHLSQEQDNVILKYDYSKSYLIANPSAIPYFAIHRVVHYLGYIPPLHSLRIILVSLVPLFFYYAMVMWSSFRRYVATRVLLPKHYEVNEHRTYFALFLATLYLTLSIAGARLSTGHTESSEWTIYVAGTLASFFLVAILTYVRKWLTSPLYKALIVIGYGLFALLLAYLTFVYHLIGNTYFVFLSLSLVPAILISHKNPSRFLESLLIQLILVFCVVGYFFLDMASLSKIEMIALILSTAVMPILYRIFVRIVPARSTILFIIASLTILVTAYYSTRQAIDYHHYSFYVGPAYELSQGKSVLRDVPSQYGYLSIAMITTLLKNYGVTFDTFRILNQWLFILFYFLTYLIIWRVTKNIMQSMLFSLIAIFFQTHFSLFSFVIAPSTGPLRFGFGLLILFFLSYFPKSVGMILSSVAAAISLFWSIESAIYTIPAYIFMIGTVSFVTQVTVKKKVIHFFRYLTHFSLSSIVIFLLILLREYQLHHTFPPLHNYVQFATVYVDGWCALLIPLFENYYLPVIILLAALVILFRQIHRRAIYLLPQLSFLVIHNFAIMSYYISRSHQNNIVNISLFFLLEGIFLFYALNRPTVLRYCILPISLFVTLFFYTTVLHVSKIYDAHEGNKTIEAVVDSYAPFADTHALSRDNTIVLSASVDTPIITTYKLKTLLPLNPALMTTLLPDHEEKYVLPNLSNLKPGTMIVVGDYGDDLLHYLQQLVELDHIPTEPHERFTLYRVRRIKL